MVLIIVSVIPNCREHWYEIEPRSLYTVMDSNSAELFSSLYGLYTEATPPIYTVKKQGPSSDNTT